MKKTCQILLLLLIATSQYNCRKEPVFIGEPDPTPVVITPNPITTNLRGYIFDENDGPAVGATIAAGDQTTVTDANGYFRINNAVLDKTNTLVTATKVGYFKGIRLFAATQGANIIKIKLVKKELTGTVNASAGGAVSLSNGSKISLPANGIVTAASNNNYSGTVNVYAKYIDPSAADIANTVPGSFAGYDKDGKRVILTSYGMLAVELESATGEKLQIKDGNIATLITSIPAGALASAPASVPLWYVDEKTGLWREEGIATKQGNTYTGTVKHFSFWNADGSVPAANLSMRLVNENNSPIQYAMVRISHPNAWLTSSIHFTDSLGQVAGIVATNEDLLMEVFEPCNTFPAYSQNIAPITQDHNLGDVMISTNIAVVTVKGQLLNCTNQPVTNGFATITHGSTTLLAATDATGHYEATFVMCTSASPIPTVDVMGTDNTNPLHNGYQSSIFLTNSTTIPNILVCNETGYIHYNIDGVDYTLEEKNDGNEDVYAMIGDAGQGPIVMVYGGSMTPFRQMTMNMGGTALGTYPVGLPNTFYATEALPATGNYTINFGNASRSTLTVIANNNGEYYEGSMNVTYTYSLDGFATGHRMDCTFRAKRRD